MKKRFLIITLFLFLLGTLCACDMNIGSGSSDKPNQNENNNQNDSEHSFEEIKAMLGNPYNFTCDIEYTLAADGSKSTGIMQANEQYLYSAGDGVIVFAELENGEIKSLYTDAAGEMEEVLDRASKEAMRKGLDIIFMCLDDNDVEYKNGKYTVKNLEKLAEVIRTQSYVENATFYVSVNYATFEVKNGKLIYKIGEHFIVNGYEYTVDYVNTFRDFGTTVIEKIEIKKNYSLNDLQEIYESHGYTCSSLSFAGCTMLTCAKEDDIIMFTDKESESMMRFNDIYYTHEGSGEALEILESLK